MVVPLCIQKVLMTDSAPSAVSSSGRPCRTAVVRFEMAASELLVYSQILDCVGNQRPTNPTGTLKLTPASFQFICVPGWYAKVFKLAALCVITTFAETTRRIVISFVRGVMMLWDGLGRHRPSKHLRLGLAASASCRRQCTKESSLRNVTEQAA